MKKLSKRAKIYLKAAEAIASGEQEYSCSAVMATGNGVNYNERFVYASTMSPDPYRELLIRDIEKAVNYWGSEAERDFRVLLLCMMAAVCDDLPETTKL